MGHTVLAVSHVCNTGTDTLHCYSENWPYHDRVLLNAEVHGHGLSLCSYLFDFPENRVYDYCHIEYSFGVMRLSDIDNFETDIDYTKVFGLCFLV